MIAVPENLLIEPHIQKVLRDYKNYYNRGDFVYVKDIKAKLLSYTIFNGINIYTPSKFKKFIYRITNFLRLTNKNLDTVNIDISDICSWLYFPTVDIAQGEIGIKCYNNILYGVNNPRYVFNFNIPSELSKVTFYDNNMQSSIKKLKHTYRISNDNIWTLYVRNIKVDNKVCNIKFEFKILEYVPSRIPVEMDITLLGQNELKYFLSYYKNHALMTKINSIENGKVIQDQDGNEKYLLDEYVPSIEEMIMFSDYAIKKYGINLETYFKKKLENLEQKELKSAYNASQLTHYVDPETIFDNAAADKEDEIKIKAVKTRRGRKKTKDDKENENDKIIKETKVKVRSTAKKNDDKKEDEKKKVRTTRKTAAKKKKEN